MSILKATIQTETARRLGRTTSDVTDYEIKSALQIITMAIPVLKGECTCDTVVGQGKYDLRSLPNKFKSVDIVSVDDGDNDATFKKIGNFEDYQDMVIGETSADYDEPEYFIVYNDFLYIFPTPDDTYTLRLFSDIYERDADAITLPDEYEECVISLTCAEVLKNKGMAESDEAKGHLSSGYRYIAEFNKLANNKVNIDQINYNDI
jgi:hypothetical protein